MSFSWRKCVKCFESGIDFFPDWQGLLIMTIVLWVWIFSVLAVSSQLLYMYKKCVKWLRNPRTVMRWTGANCSRISLSVVDAYNVRDRTTLAINHYTIQWRGKRIKKFSNLRHCPPEKPTLQSLMILISSPLLILAQTGR